MHRGGPRKFELDPVWAVPRSQDDLSCAWLTGILRDSEATAAAMGPQGFVSRVMLRRADDLPKGKTGAQFVRLALQYNQLPVQSAPPPPAVIVKLSTRHQITGSNRETWIGEQDAREVRFYREHSAKLLAKCCALHASFCMSREGTLCCHTCIVMEDLSESHANGEELIAPVLHGLYDGLAASTAGIQEMARLHSATWNCGFDRGQEASFLTSVCFRCGSGHDAHKSILSGSTNFVDLLQARQRQTGSILRISFESWVTPPTIAQESQFCVALADATPALRDNDVMSMLRAVERGYGSMATASAATDTWKRMSNSHNALVHGDFHPGNLMLPRSSRAHLDEGAAYVLDFQHWGWAPVAFEVLYWIAHAIPMFNIAPSSIGWLVQSYVRTLSSMVPQPLTAAELSEEMLAIMVEWCASFLVDETHDGRPHDSHQSRQTIHVGAIQKRVHGGSPTVVAPRDVARAVAQARQISTLMRVGADLLFQESGARETPLARYLHTSFT